MIYKKVEIKVEGYQEIADLYRVEEPVTICVLRLEQGMRWKSSLIL